MKKLIFAVSICLLLGTTNLMALPSLEGKIRLGADLEYLYLLGGDAGKFESGTFRLVPEISEVFGNGYGAKAELGYLFDENYELIFGAGYLVFPGESTTMTSSNGDVIGLETENFNLIPIYVGARFVFGENEERDGFMPYIRVDGGLVWMDSVDAQITYQPSGSASPTVFSTRWWDTSSAFMWDLGFGVEYGFGNFGAFAQFMYRSFGKPESAISTPLSGVVISADGTSWSPLLFSLGISYYF